MVAHIHRTRRFFSRQETGIGLRRTKCHRSCPNANDGLPESDFQYGGRTSLKRRNNF